MALIHFTEESFNEALNNNKVVVADFFATWCNPCKMLSPIIEDLAQELDGKAAIGKIDVEQVPALAEKFDVMTVPTVHIFMNGELVSTLTGYKPKQVLLDEIKKYL